MSHASSINTYGHLNDQFKMRIHSNRLLEIADQGHIADFSPALEDELFAIARPREAEYFINREVGQPYRHAARDHLLPDVRDAAAHVNVAQCAPVRRPAQTGA